MTLFRHLLPVLPLVVLATAHADGINAQLNFINGDKLTGTPGEINADGNLILVARSGRAAGEPRIDVWDRETGESNQDIFLASLDPRGLTVGEYVLTVAVSNERTGFTESNSIPFSVVERVRISDSR